MPKGESPFCGSLSGPRRGIGRAWQTANIQCLVGASLPVLAARFVPRCDSACLSARLLLCACSGRRTQIGNRSCHWGTTAESSFISAELRRRGDLWSQVVLLLLPRGSDHRVATLHSRAEICARAPQSRAHRQYSGRASNLARCAEIGPHQRLHPGRRLRRSLHAGEPESGAVLLYLAVLGVHPEVNA